MRSRDDDCKFINSFEVYVPFWDLHLVTPWSVFSDLHTEFLELSTLNRNNLLSQNSIIFFRSWPSESSTIFRMDSYFNLGQIF